ncbi:hypothetical protein HGA09_18595, partial [Cellulomonas hominis]|nr:hypothetical protein [Cellulomonas hominis]
MGDHANQLGRTLDADLGTITSTGDALGYQATAADQTATGLTSISGQIGLDGESALAAEGRLGEVAGRIQRMVADLERIQSAGAQARDALARAQDSYHALPDVKLSRTEQAQVTALALTPVVGAPTSAATAAALLARKEVQREQEASRALETLRGDLGAIQVQNVGTYDFQGPAGTDDPGTSGGSTPTGGTGVRGYSAGGTGSGGSGTGAGWSPGSTSGGAPVSTGWTPSGSGDGGAGSGSGGSGGSGGGGGSTGGTVGSGPVLGGGTGGGTVPGHGDGSSSDGVVGGTVPGGAGSGGGFLGGPGGSGAAGGSGSGSGAGS